MRPRAPRHALPPTVGSSATATAQTNNGLGHFQAGERLIPPRAPAVPGLPLCFCGRLMAADRHSGRWGGWQAARGNAHRPLPACPSGICPQSSRASSLGSLVPAGHPSPKERLVPRTEISLFAVTFRYLAMHAECSPGCERSRLLSSLFRACWASSGSGSSSGSQAPPPTAV